MGWGESQVRAGDSMLVAQGGIEKIRYKVRLVEQPNSMHPTLMACPCANSRMHIQSRRRRLAKLSPRVLRLVRLFFGGFQTS